MIKKFIVVIIFFLLALFLVTTISKKKNLINSAFNFNQKPLTEVSNSRSAGKNLSLKEEISTSYETLPGFPAQNKLDTSKFVVYQVWFNYYAKNTKLGQNSENVFLNASQFLPELAKMGVNVIQLSPFHPFRGQGTTGSPYGSLDYYEINPGYAPGNRQKRIDALSSYINQAHDLGIKVIMDCVYHSTDPKNVLMTSYPNFYQHDASGKVVQNRYNFAVLDYSNPQTTIYMINMVKFWEKTVDIDGCRADVAVDVPLAFWAMLNNEMKKIKPGWLMVAETASQLETYGGTYSGQGFQPGEQYNKVYGFDALYGVKYMKALRAIINNKVTPDEISSIADNPDVQEMFLGDNKYYLSVDNHDQRPRAAALAGGNSAMVAAMVLNFTLPGIPFLFNGQQIGDTTPTSIKNQLFISWDKPPHPENKTLFKKLIDVRLNHPALTNGEVSFFSVNNSAKVISYLKTADQDKIIVAVNFSPQSWTGNINIFTTKTPGNKITNLLSPSASQEIKNGKLIFSLPAWGYFLGEIK